MENEGAITGTPAPAGDLAGNAGTQTSEPDPWSFAEPPAEVETETPETKEPITEPLEQPADKTAEPPKEETVLANPFPQEDKRHGQFEGLRKHADTLLAEVKQYKPLAEKVQALGDPAVVDIVAPLMNITERGPQAVQTAQQVIDGFSTYDGLIGDAIKEASYVKHRDDYFTWALEDKGITPDIWDQFEKFRANPAAFAPPGLIVSSQFPTPITDPNSDQFGLVTIQAPDGSPVTLNTAEPAQNFTYQLAKKDWEREQADSRTRAETEAKSKQEQARAAYQAEEKRAADFTGLCDQDLEAEFTGLNLSVAATPSSIPNMTDADVAKLLTWGIARTWMDRDENHQKAFTQGVSVARRGGTGRLESSRLMLKTSARSHLEKAKGLVEGIFKELQGYRQAASKGTLHESPRIPTDATPVFTDQSAQQPELGRPSKAVDVYDEIWR